MREVLEYLKECGVFYVATNEQGQPRVRPFGVVADFEDKLYISTNNQKDVFKQMQENPKIEISGMKNGTWIRVEAIVVRDNRKEAREKMLADNPSLEEMYAADDGKMEVLYFQNATATISSFNGEPKVITFN